MDSTTSSNFKLGLFVSLGLIFLLATLYLIGNNHNLFDRTFEVKATFYNVGGLTKGNNVRFAGIDVGTIQRVEIITDTSVQVTMIIQNEARKFIKTTSVASVGTDGLMGNKLVNIANLTTMPSEIIGEGGILITIKPVETDDMLRTLGQTNRNLYDISIDIKKITEKISNNNSLWSILTDTTVAENLKQSIISIRYTTRNTAAFTHDLNYLLQDVKNGKGLAGALLRDSATSASFRRTIQQLQATGEKALQVTNDLKILTEKLKKGEGGGGILLSDTSFAIDLKRSMHNVEVGSGRFSEDMEALKQNFLFRGYFRRQEKELKKAKADSLQRTKSKQ